MNHLTLSYFLYHFLVLRASWRLVTQPKEHLEVIPHFAGKIVLGQVDAAR
jgi:hypothetical protein